MAFCLISLHAFPWQTVERSRLTDNWFVNLSTGCYAHSSHTVVFRHLNPSITIGIGRYLTPVYGLELQSTAAFDDGPDGTENGLAVKQSFLLLNHHINLNHLICGYNGRPDIFEIIATAGLGWQHSFEKHPTDYRTTNNLASRFALQFTYNPGCKRAWQLFLEPSLTYEMKGTSTDYQPYFNVNRSQIGLSVGVAYRFKNSNGTHHFKWARLYDQVEVGALNAKINELRRQLRQKQKSL